jgi:hypothetical protein
VQNAAHFYGFVAFTVDPGPHAGAITTIKVTYCDLVGPGRRVGTVRNLHTAPPLPRLDQPRSDLVLLHGGFDGLPTIILVAQA